MDGEKRLNTIHARGAVAVRILHKDFFLHPNRKLRRDSEMDGDGAARFQLSREETHPANVETYPLPIKRRI